MSEWDAALDRRLCALVDRIVREDAGAWRELMVALAPHLERWARASRVLRRCRLTGDDDQRAVMVLVFERLAEDRFANLRRFVARQPAAADPEADLVDEVVRLGKLEDDDPGNDAPVGETPLRAWLLTSLEFAARDHVRQRFGWSVKPGEPTKRSLHTDAAPIEEAPEPATRPPMTDRLTVSKLVAEVHAHIKSFPADMRSALLLWLDDLDYASIASQLALDDATRARALVRAGQARLRERFRGRSPLLFAS